MGRFTPIDLSRLPALPTTALTFEQYYAAYMADLTKRLNGAGIPYNVGALETDTYAITGEAYSYRTLLVAKSIDDAIAAVMLPTSWGAYLDNLGATQDPPVQRNALVAAPRPYAQFPQDWESDASFRYRIQLAPNELSTCGPEGAYLSFALAPTVTVAGTTYGVGSAATYGPMSFGGKIASPFTPLGCVDIPIVATIGDGTAPDQLVAAVQAAVGPDERRPIADFVTVSAATILDYTIAATLYVGSGADSGTVLSAAYARARAAADLAHRPGGRVRDQDLYAALKVPDAQGRPIVDDVSLTGWSDVNAAIPAPGATGPAYIAPYCQQLAAGAAPQITANADGSTGLVAGGISLRIVTVDE